MAQRQGMCKTPVRTLLWVVQQWYRLPVVRVTTFPLARLVVLMLLLVFVGFAINSSRTRWFRYV